MSGEFVSWEQAVNWLLTQPDQQELVLHCYFDRPVREAVRRYARDPEWQALRALLPSRPGHALDVGAGNGIVSYALAKENWRVTAIEPDPSEFVGAAAIDRLAQEENLPIETVRTFGEDLPFADATFDCVIARQVMHHAHDLTRMYGQMARVLKPGGVLIACRDHVIDHPAGLEEFRANHPLHRLYGGENAFRLDEYTRAIHDAGLVTKRLLRQFDSVINYAPLTREQIVERVAERLPGPLRPLARATLGGRLCFPLLLRIASRFDRRQGRLVTFVCEKPK